MIPLLEPGDEVLVNPRAAIREADIVVARHPYRQDSIWIKYVAAFDDAGRAQLVGLNAHESTDSRTQGNVPMELILGKVTSRFGSKNSMT